MKRGVLFIDFGLGGVDQHRVWDLDVFFSLFIFWEGYFGIFWDILYGWLISLGLFLCIDLFLFGIGIGGSIHS